MDDKELKIKVKGDEINVMVNGLSIHEIAKCVNALLTSLQNNFNEKQKAVFQMAIENAVTIAFEVHNGAGK